MNRRRALAATGLTLASVLFVACASERVSGVRAPAVRSAPEAGTAALGCRFAVRAIEDRRDDKGLGRLHATGVGGEGFAEWFADGIAAIPGYTSHEAPTELRLEVLKAYITGINTLKSANLVVRVHAASAAGGATKSTTYRGVDGSINWANGEGEVQEAFDRALADLQRQLAEDLSRSCKR